MGVIVAGLIPISTSPFNINSCSPISRGRVSGLLWPRSTSINMSSVIIRWRVDGQTWPKSTISAVNWGRGAGILRTMSMTFTTTTITWRRVAGLKRPMSTTFLSWIHSHTFVSEFFSLLLWRREEEWMVLRDQYPRLRSVHIVNNTFSDSRSLGVMNDIGEIYHGNWVSTRKWGAM